MGSDTCKFCGKRIFKNPVHVEKETEILLHEDCFRELLNECETKHNYKAERLTELLKELSDEGTNSV
jgi:hypothetical protein